MDIVFPPTAESVKFTESFPVTMTKAAQKAVKDNPSIHQLYNQFRVGGSQRDKVIAELYYLPPHFTAMLASMLYPLGQELVNVLANRLVDRFMADQE